MISLTQEQWDRILALIPKAQRKNLYLKSVEEDLVPLLSHSDDPGTVLKYWQLFPDWMPGPFTTGQNCLYEGYPYAALAPGHDSTENPAWNPTDAPSLFKAWHGISPETALPWRAPTGAHDIYKEGEYMVWTDESIKQCTQDTSYSPADYPQAWENA